MLTPILISWDTEHAPFDDYQKLQPLTCVSYAAEGGGANVFHVHDPHAKGIVERALRAHISVGANIAHDMAEVCFEWPDLTPLVWQAYADGRVRDLIQCERLITIAAGEYLPACAKNLEELALKYGFGQLDKSEDVRLGYGSLRDMPLDAWSDAQRRYPVEDARAGLAVAMAQPPPVDWENASRADFICDLMGVWGFHTDLARVEKLRAHCRNKIDGHIALLTGAGLLRPNKKQASGYSKNMAAIKEKVVASGATRETAGHQICCDAEALAGSGDPALKALADYASTVKRLGACDILSRGRLHCWFKPVQENNQTSCSTPYNAQNPPTDGGERECIIPAPGNVFIDADFDLYHLRAFSQVCIDIVGHSEMAKVLNNPTGPKIHVVTGAALAGIPIDQFDKKGAHAKLYTMAKRYNFALLADAGYDRIAAACSKDGIHLDKEEFWQAKNTWKRTYPEAPLYFNYIQEIAGDHYATITELVTGRVRGGCSYTDAANGYFSALANSAMKAAWFVLARECYDPSRNSILFGSRPVLEVHDQLFVETPNDEGAHDRAMRVKAIMESETLPFMPDVPPTTEPCLATCWSKTAEAVYDKDGRLTPWSP